MTARAHCNCRFGLHNAFVLTEEVIDTRFTSKDERNQGSQGSAVACYKVGRHQLCKVNRMQKIIDVQIGEVSVGQGEVILQSKAIGSCIAIVAYDATKNIGALAHVMLPGRAPAKKATERIKYASDAIDVMVKKMTDLGSKSEDIKVVLVGGGNVLNRKDDTICQDNIESTLEFLGEKGLKVMAQAVGGINRRSVSVSVESGKIFYAEGDGKEKVLWEAKKRYEE